MSGPSSAFGLLLDPTYGVVMTEKTIDVNGNAVPWHEGMTVRDVLKACNYVFPMLVVNVDGKLVNKKDYDRAVIPTGAVVKVVHLVSGG